MTQHESLSSPITQNLSQAEQWQAFEASGDAASLRDQQREHAVDVAVQRWRLARKEYGEGSSEMQEAEARAAQMILASGVCLPLHDAEG